MLGGAPEPGAGETEPGAGTHLLLEGGKFGLEGGQVVLQLIDIRWRRTKPDRDALLVCEHQLDQFGLDTTFMSNAVGT